MVRGLVRKMPKAQKRWVLLSGILLKSHQCKLERTRWNAGVLLKGQTSTKASRDQAASSGLMWEIYVGEVLSWKSPPFTGFIPWECGIYSGNSPR